MMFAFMIKVVWSALEYMGRGARKPVYGVSEKARLEPACSATENSLKFENSLVASLDMVLSNKLITNAGMCRLVCVFVVRKPQISSALA